MLVNGYPIIVELVVDGPELCLPLGAEGLPLLELLLAVVDAVLRLEDQLLQLLARLAPLSLLHLKLGLTFILQGLSLTSSSSGGSVMHCS